MSGRDSLLGAGLSAPLRTPSFWRLFLAHLLLELGFLIDEVFFAIPIVFTVLFVLVVGATNGQCVGINTDNCWSMDGRGIEVRRIVNPLQWCFLVLWHGTTRRL